MGLRSEPEGLKNPGADPGFSSDFVSYTRGAPAEIGTWSNERAGQPKWKQKAQQHKQQQEEESDEEEEELAAVQLPDNLTFISTNNQVL